VKQQENHKRSAGSNAQEDEDSETNSKKVKIKETGAG
jgi:hypothetical protein